MRAARRPPVGATKTDGVTGLEERDERLKGQGQMAKRNPPSAKVRMRLALGALSLWAFAILLNTVHNKPALAALDDRNADSFRILASELVVDFDRFATDTGQEGLAVAVWPQPVGQVPVPPHVASEINDRLLSALLTEGGHRHRLVARDTLRAVVEDLAESTDLTRNLDTVLSALAERAKADVLVVCKLRDLGGGRMLLSYRAVNIEDGSIIAATSHRELEMSPSAMSEAVTAMSLEQALLDAVRALSDGVDDMEILHLQGIEFADSGRETPFGRYVEGRLADALSESYENPITDRSIVLRYNGLMKGLAVAPGKGLHDVPGAYRLSGNYWDFGDVIELRLSLQDQEGPVVVWRERVRASSVPEALRRQPLDALAETSDNDHDLSGPAVSAPPRETVMAKRTSDSRETPFPRVVLQVQRSLRRLGYRPGPVDGIYGPMTRAAIHDYQRDHGLPADGRITLDLADHLYDSSARVADQRDERYERDDRRDHYGRGEPPQSSQAALPAGYIPPPGYCRVWFDHWSPNLQPPLATCDQFVGPLPNGARLVFGSEAWPSPSPHPKALFAVLTGHGGVPGMTDRDRARASSAYTHAGTAAIGEAIEWSNPSTGNGGRIVALREGISSLGSYCREFRQSVTIAGRRQQAYGIACQETDGSWQLVSK
jgi:surface antigen